MNKQRPVVVYLHRYPIEFEAEQFPATLALLKLLSEKFEVVYFSMGGPEKNETIRAGFRFEEISLKINRVDSSDKWLKTFLYYFHLPATLRRLRQLQPDFIICKETLPFVPSLVVRLRRPTLIDISDWWFSIMLGKNRLGRWFARLIESREVRDWNKFRVVAVTHTRAESNLMVEKGMARSKLQIINAPQHEGVYFPTEAQSERPRWGLQAGDWVVAVHGIIHPSKGYDQLLTWWAELVKSRPNWKLLIIGGSGEEDGCRKQIATLKLESHARMTGWLPGHVDVNLALNAADCLLVTRRNSPENVGVIPSSLYHSLALVKPTVVTGMPGMAEVIQDKVNGFAFVPDSYASFKSTLEFVCDHPDEARQAAIKGEQTAKESFDLNTCAQKYFSLIDQAVTDFRAAKITPPK